MPKLRGLLFFVILMCASGARAFVLNPPQLHAPQMINPQSPSLEHLQGPRSVKPLDDASPRLDPRSGLPTGKRSHNPITIKKTTNSASPMFFHNQ